jgi:hypothetical protein
MATADNYDVEGLIEHRKDLTADFAARNTGRGSPGQKRRNNDLIPPLG